MRRSQDEAVALSPGAIGIESLGLQAMAHGTQTNQVLFDSFSHFNGAEQMLPMASASAWACMTSCSALLSHNYCTTVLQHHHVELASEEEPLQAG